VSEVGWCCRYAGAKQLWSNIRLTAITELIPRRKGLSLYVRAKFVLDTLKTFFASADPSITTAHVPTEKVDSDGQRTALDHAIRMVSGALIVTNQDCCHVQISYNMLLLSACDLLH